MNRRINTRYEEMCLVVWVKTIQPVKIRLRVYDHKRPKTVFTDRYMTVRGVQKFYVRMPLSSDYVIVSVYNEAKGNLPTGQDSTFELIKVDKVPLEKRTSVGDLMRNDVQEFVSFVQRFCFNAPYLDAGKTYQSSSGRFMIEYMPVITSSKTGRPLRTPARISKGTGRIQVSKGAFDQYSVPMGIAILLHEFAHFYMNDNMDDESEADLNGLLIYMALGYPRIEAHKAYLEVFRDTPTIQNKNRYDKIKKFINNFDKNKMIIQ